MPLHPTTPRPVARTLAAGGVLALTAAGFVALAPPAQAAPQGAITGTPCNTACVLTAKPGTSTLVAAAGTAAAVTVPVWSFTSDGAAPTVGVGPTLVVTQQLDGNGKVKPVTITLDDQLPEAGPLSLAIPGMTGLADDTAGITTGTKGYTFTPTRPGSYLYEAGHTANGARQAAMGLVGAIVVRPADGSVPADDEAVLVLTDVDPKLNTSADKLNFDLRSFSNSYRLVNGRPYPRTTSIVSAPGRKVLLRYVNAGMLPHSMGVLGARQTVTAIDAQPSDNAPLVADQIAPGSTEDAVVTVPSSGGTLPVYDTSGALDTAGRKTGSLVALGGMMTTIQAAAVAVPGGPVVSAAISPAITGTGPVTLAGQADALPGGQVGAIEYSLDGSPFSAISAVTGAASVPFTVSIPAPTTGGVHQVVVRASDTSTVPVVGTPVTLSFTVDLAGPTTSAVVTGALATNLSQPLNVSARFDDPQGSRIVAGEVFVGTPGGVGSGLAMTPTDGAFNAAGEFAFAAIPGASFPAPPADGPVTISVHGKDVAGNWGAFGTTTVIVDRVAPTVGTVTPTQTPATLPLTRSVSLSGSATDASAVVQAEWFEGTDPGSGKGQALALSPAAGATSVTFGGTTGQLAAGPHTLSVRVRDAAGNWSAVKAVPVTVTADRLFANGFEPGDTSWSGTGASNPAAASALTAAAALERATGLQVTANGTRTWYQVATTTGTSGYHAGFLFNAGTLTVGSTSTSRYLQLYSLRTAAIQKVGVYFRRTGTTGAYQLQLAAGTPSPTGWVTVTGTGKDVVLVDWSGTSATVKVNGTQVGAAVTVAGTSATASWLGIASATTGTAGSAWLDGFVANATLPATTQPSLLP